MCGRFTLTEPDAGVLLETFSLTHPPDPMPPRYNIAPTQGVATVVSENDGSRVLRLMRWGLIPAWAKDPSIGSRMINARSETVAEKPAFRNALKRRRCLIIADGFYEWQKQPGGKVPMFITLKDRQPFGFAGLYETWTEPEGGASVTTCTIITGPANTLIAPIHDRMPIIMPPDAYGLWLDPREMNTALLTGLLKPYPAEQMMAYPVSARVNTPTFDDPGLIERTG